MKTQLIKKLSDLEFLNCKINFNSLSKQELIELKKYIKAKINTNLHSLNMPIDPQGLEENFLPNEILKQRINVLKKCKNILEEINKILKNNTLEI